MSAFEQRRSSTNHSAEQERIAYLEKKIQAKDEVLAELMSEHVALPDQERRIVGALVARGSKGNGGINPATTGPR